MIHVVIGTDQNTAAFEALSFAIALICTLIPILQSLLERGIAYKHMLMCLFGQGACHVFISRAER